MALPYDVWSVVLGFADSLHLARCAQVCRDWNDIARTVWERALSRTTHFKLNCMLAKAVKAGLADKIAKLLASGANARFNYVFNRTNLHFAAMSGDNVEVVKMLIDSGANVNAVDDNHCTPLHVAVRNGARGVVGALIAAGANPNIRDIDRQIPLQYIVEDVVRGGSSDIAFEIVNTRHTPVRPGSSVLHVATESGNLNAVYALVHSGCDVTARDVTGATALHNATREGHREVVKCLISAGCNVNAEQNTGETALHLAVSRDHYDIAVDLLFARANVDAKDATGQTALHLAAAGGYHHTVKILLGFCADVWVKDINRHTAYDIAVGKAKLILQKAGGLRLRIEGLFA